MPIDEPTLLWALFALLVGAVAWSAARAVWARRAPPPPLPSERDLRRARVRNLRGSESTSASAEPSEEPEAEEPAAEEPADQEQDEQDEQDETEPPTHASVALADCPAAASGANTDFACAPLRSLQELLAWAPSNEHRFMRAVEQLPASAAPGGQRLLVCHDMRGGYNEDRLAQSQAVPDGEDDYFRLYHWHAIDVFVYFSHDFVTIPPVGWTNAAHLHGTAVLGTLITEWEAGAELCRRMLATPEAAVQAARQLAAIARAYRFDGWLVNIENPVLSTDNLKLFLSSLHEAVHLQCGPGAQVLWYDAVTATDGQLRHQSQLNAATRPFFDLCDGLFVDYHWTADLPAASAARAGERRHDVFYGIDVFGRGTLGGGGMDCDVALRVAREAGVSAALFAPGWVHENKPAGERFLPRQDRFWAKVQATWPPTRRPPARAEFRSSFCQGAGDLFAVGGHTAARGRWFCLGLQSAQPVVRARAAALASDDGASKLLVALTQHHAFDGGSSLLVQGVVAQGRASRLAFPAFNTAVAVPRGGGVLEVSYVVSRARGCDVCLSLRVEGGAAGVSELVLRGPRSAAGAGATDVSERLGRGSRGQSFFLPAEVELFGSSSSSPDQAPMDLRAEVDSMRRRGVPLHEVRDRLAEARRRRPLAAEELQWQRRTYRLTGLGGRELRQISVVCTATGDESVYRCVLGEVAARAGPPGRSFVPRPVRGLRVAAVSDDGLSLVWRASEDATAWDVLLLSGSSGSAGLSGSAGSAGSAEEPQQRWLGRARAPTFRVSPRPDGPGPWVFAVQPISASGVRPRVASTLSVVP